MMLYVVRHGEAEEGPDDSARLLTKGGRKEVTATARIATAAGLEVQRIIHSPRRRALETAEIWAKTLKSKPKLEASAAVDPLADPHDAAGFTAAAEESLMIVGHLPHLGRLVSLLVTGNLDKEIVLLPTGAVAALVQEAGGWQVRWLLTPKLARAGSSAHDRK